MKSKYLYLKHLKAGLIICLLLQHGGAMAGGIIRIFDKLEAGKVAETVSIKLGDETKTIVIDQANPQAYAQFACPDGTWPYSIETMTSVSREGSSYSVRGRTNSAMDCNGDADFDLIGDYSLYGVLLSLQNKQTPASPPTAHQPPAGNNSACRQIRNPFWKPVSIVPIDSSHPYGFSVSTENPYIWYCPK